MATVAVAVLEFLRRNPGASDSEINGLVFAGTKNHAHINIVCHSLEARGLIRREKRFGYQIANYPTDAVLSTSEFAHRTLAEQATQTVRDDIQTHVTSFCDEASDQFHRYFSWDHCYKALGRRREIRASSEELDRAGLHLAFYLASWGMLRGSGRLFWKNYKFYVPAVEAIVDPDFDVLWDICSSQPPSSGVEDLIFGARGILNRIHRAWLKLDRKMMPSDILTTKILLGAFACSPAYDRFVSSGLKTAGLTARWGPRSLRQVSRFYREHEEQFRSGLPEVTSSYPPMKLADMYFFQLGQQRN